MGTSSLLGTQGVPTKPAGSDAEALGPSDSSDSASDMVGAETAEEREENPPEESADISVDRVVGPPGSEREDEDPDLSFMDEAEAPDPLEDERAEAGDDPTDNEMAAPRPPPAREPKPVASKGRPRRRAG